MVAGRVADGIIGDDLSIHRSQQIMPGRVVLSLIENKNNPENLQYKNLDRFQLVPGSLLPGTID